MKIKIKLLKEISKTAESKCKIREWVSEWERKREQWHSEDVVSKREYNKKCIINWSRNCIEVHRYPWQTIIVCQREQQ